MKIQKKRRRQAKTDYAKRIRLLKGNCPRIVFRKTNKYLIAQYVISEQAQDKVEIGINSKILLKYGWTKQAQGSLKSITASYFIGLLIGKKIAEKKFLTPIIDFGMIRNLHKTKIYAFIKGLIDSGLKIKFDEKKEIFPSNERIKGEHLKNKIPFEKIKEKIGREK